MAQKTHDTFLLHTSYEKMFTSVSPEQSQRLISAVFKLAKTGEVEDLSDDVVLEIFFEQIATFMIRNERAYADACAKKSEQQKKRWEEAKKAQETIEQQNKQPQEFEFDLRNIMGGKV